MNNTAENKVILDALFFAVNRVVIETADTVVFWSVQGAVYENVADSAFPGVVPGAVDTDTTNHTLQDFLRESVFERYEVLQKLVGG